MPSLWNEASAAQPSEEAIRQALAKVRTEYDYAITATDEQDLTARLKLISASVRQKAPGLSRQIGERISEAWLQRQGSTK